MPESDVTVDRAAVRRLVEDFWRSLVLFGRHMGETQPNITPAAAQAQFVDFSRQFHERNEATAALMAPDRAKAFLQVIDEEDAICFQEHQTNKPAFYRRLGLNFTENDRRPVVYQRQNIGEMAVRTAVRATIWELIFALFRLFR